MASVFLSYDHEDANRGRRVARALQRAGHSVWWDQRIKSGAQYGREIDEALNRADAVVVLWSAKSIESAWVRDEAAAGRDQGKLVPARIDEVDPPLGFRQYQTTDLIRWKGRRTAEFDEMVEAIASLPAGAQAQDMPGKPGPRHRIPSKLSRPVIGIIALLAILATGLMGWALIVRPAAIPVVAVAPADGTLASQMLARDLLVKLGTLHTAQPDSIDLISQGDEARKPTLIFQVGRIGRPERAEANLALTDPKHRSLLWAKDFSDPKGNEADLRQQLGYSAARVLRCALQGMNPEARKLTRQMLKTYLTACAAMPDIPTADAAALVPALQVLVKHAPQFAGGWSKLLLAETAVATDPLRPEARSMRTVVARHIVQARKVHPGLAEAYLAEYALTPDAHFLERSKILDNGIQRNPDSPELRYARNSFLASVGRNDDALRDAERAVELDPLSPNMREGYVMALAFSGRVDEAFAELNDAERLWPGATTLRSARYILHLRTGNPREALSLLRAGVLQGANTGWMRIQEDLLEALIDPSPDRVEKAIQTARDTYERLPPAIAGLEQTLVEFHREEELFRLLLNWRRMDLVSFVTDVLFRPKFSDFHKDARFMQVAKRLGLLDYWQASGKWPDLCSRADLPYDCKVEATKLASLTMKKSSSADPGLVSFCQNKAIRPKCLKSFAKASAFGPFRTLGS